MKQWFLIETQKEYQEATKRFEEIYQVNKNDPEFKEMQLLAFLINKYEKTKWELPQPDPIDLIKSRMEDLDLKPADLAREYGDKGTISKVLNYKQPLSLNMIRRFSKLLNIPAELLTKEYELKTENLSAHRKNNLRKPLQQSKRTTGRKNKTSTAA